MKSKLARFDFWLSPIWDATAVACLLVGLFLFLTSLPFLAVLFIAAGVALFFRQMAIGSQVNALWLEVRLLQIQAAQVNAACKKFGAGGQFPPTHEGFVQLMRALTLETVFTGARAVKIIEMNNGRLAHSQLVPVPPHGGVGYWSVSSPLLAEVEEINLGDEGVAQARLATL
jgi:hypothetical protein